MDRKKLQNLAIVFAAGFLGMWLIAWPGAPSGMMPGDIGDARFNAYFLEHFFLCLTGKVHGFWNAPFFYPFPLTTAFSDSHLGTGIVYSFFRGIGFGPEDAFRWWFLSGFVANYAACAFVLEKFRLRPVAVAAGAFIFTFNLAVLAQSDHAQLDYRFGIPLAFFYFYRGAREGKLADLFWCAFWFTWQLYADIYLGIFLAMLLAAFCVALLVVHVPGRMRGGESLGAIFAQRAARGWRNAGRLDRWLALAGVPVLGGLAAWLLHPYLMVTRLYGFARSWEDVSRMLPRPESYLFASNSRLWPHDLQMFRGLPFQPEQALFLGAAVWILFDLTALGVVDGRIARAERKNLLAPLLLAMAALVALTISIRGHTLYIYVYSLPGINAVRAVARIILALIFPVAVVCAFGVDALAARARLHKGALLAMAALLAALFLESACITDATFPSAESSRRLAKMESAFSSMPREGGGAPVLFVPLRAGESYYKTEIDAMILAQRHGLATLNGYSASYPPGIALETTGGGAANRISAYYRFMGSDDEAQAAALAKRVVVWDGGAFRPLDWLCLNKPFAGPVPEESIPGLKLEVRGMSVRNGKLDVSLFVDNASAFRFPATSTTGNNLSYTWCYTPAGDDTPPEDADWTTRWQLQQDLLPGVSQRVEMRGLPPPAKPGDYRMHVSMVQEMVVWFHHAGMQSATATQEIRVAPDGGVTLLPGD